MNIYIVTLGTRGDVQPYVALGKGLKERGHNVTVSTSSSFELFITSHGLNYGYLNNSMIELINTVEGRELLENLGSLRQWVKIFSKLYKVAKDMQPRFLNESWDCIQKTKPDLIIFHPKAYWGPNFADVLNIPCILALPLPIHIPTMEYPCVVFPQWKLGGWYNLFTHHFILVVSNYFQRRYHKKWAKDKNLPPLPKKLDILHNRYGKHITVLNAYSEHLMPRPSDWNENVHITGYWFLDEQGDFQPSDELQSFLNAGEPPVYVGFGSMAGKKPERVTRIVIEALQKANVRGILASGWGGLASEELPDSILMIDHAPHDWLFPRVSAVVHHGGAGTTAAGLRAGKPTVICPFLVDQPFWGRLVFEMGVGSKPIPQKKLTVDNLAAAIVEVTNNPSIKLKAEETGKKIRNEDGIKSAIEIIENCVSESN